MAVGLFLGCGGSVRLAIYILFEDGFDGQRRWKRGGTTTGSATGTYAVTITGTSGSIQHSVTINVTVTS